MEHGEGSEPDDEAFRGLESIRYAVTQRQKAAAGWVALSGNHLLIETDVGPQAVPITVDRGLPRSGEIVRVE